MKPAEALLDGDMLASHDQAVRYYHPLAEAEAGKRTAVDDWVFDLGSGRWRSSTFRRRVAAGDWEEAADKCRRWVHGGVSTATGD